MVHPPATSSPRPGVSVLILTRDEERSLPACLDSVAFSDDVVVLDSGSKDATRSVARARGARVVERPFDNYATQRNHGLRNIDYRNEWLLMLDADERVTADLRDEILATLETAGPDTTLYRVRHKNMFMGRWLRHTTLYPTWSGRLARLGHVWIEREVHEEYCTDGETGYLRGHLLHYPFAKGIDHWLARHQRYAAMEARWVAGHPPAPRWRDLLHPNPVRRRRSLKALAYRVPGRPIWVFLYLMVLRRGFLEGRAGLAYAQLRTVYERMIDLQRLELERRAQGQPF